jgi:tetratricopeptide (TPR) repeat protein
MPLEIKKSLSSITLYLHLLNQYQFMENTKSLLNRLFITLFLVTLAPEVYSESPYKKAIYNTFINREMYKWGSIIHTIEYGKPLTTVDQTLDLINLYYGYIGHLIGKKQYASAEIMISRGEKLIHQVLKASPKNATAYAYKGSFLGFRMGISKFRAFALGRESLADINKAYRLDPQNIQAIIDKGNFLYYTPNLFGGDKEEALNFYLKGSRILEKNKDTDQNWVYLNLLTTIALAYDKIDKRKEAKLICEKILRKEPNYKWVKDVLYPKLLE